MFTSTFWSVVLASSLACVITTTGIPVICRYEKEVGRGFRRSDGCRYTCGGHHHVLEKV